MIINLQEIQRKYLVGLSCSGETAPVPLPCMVAMGLLKNYIVIFNESHDI